MTASTDQHDHDGSDGVGTHDGHDGHDGHGRDGAWHERLETLAPDELRALAGSLPVLEQAKGILMGHYGCDARTAFLVLRRLSSARHLKVRDVARALVDSVADGDGADGHPGSGFDGVSRFLRASGADPRPEGRREP